VKSPHKASGAALYDIRESGIRDVPQSGKDNSGDTTSCMNESSKRQRL
jgi:hypothetical protein